MGFFIKGKFHLHAGAIIAGKELKSVNILERHVNNCNKIQMKSAVGMNLTLFQV